MLRARQQYLSGGRRGGLKSNIVDRAHRLKTLHFDVDLRVGVDTETDENQSQDDEHRYYYTEDHGLPLPESTAIAGRDDVSVTQPTLRPRQVAQVLPAVGDHDSKAPQTAV